MSSEAKSADNESDISLEEAHLIWDEYKYRHDLIWKHLIRSTIAVIALLTVSYSTALNDVDSQLVKVASILAILYIIFNYFVLNKELELLENIKTLHRRRQKNLYKLYMDVDVSAKKKIGGFSVRVQLYLAGLLILAVVAAAIEINPKFKYMNPNEQPSLCAKWSSSFG